MLIAACGCRPISFRPNAIILARTPTSVSMPGAFSIRNGVLNEPNPGYATPARSGCVHHLWRCRGSDMAQADSIAVQSAPEPQPAAQVRDHRGGPRGRLRFRCRLNSDGI